jgi:hypothetical protein
LWSAILFLPSACLFIPSLAYSRKRKSIEINLLDRFGHLAASGLALPPTLTSGGFPSTIISPYTSFLFDLFFGITLDDNKGDRLNDIRSFRLSFAVGCRSCLRSTNCLFATVERIPPPNHSPTSHTYDQTDVLREA